MSNRYFSSFVTLSGKVFISEDELFEALSSKYPEKCKWDEVEAEWEDETSRDEKKEVFEILAYEELSNLIPNHNVMKVQETTIDMDSFSY